MEEAIRNGKNPHVELIKTEDGSVTISRPDLEETFHSVHGAITESMHVFIDHGIRAFNGMEATIFELGFGTGLNVLLTLLEARWKGLDITYYTVESCPLEPAVIAQLNYPSLLPGKPKEELTRIHAAPWGQMTEIEPHFRLFKRLSSFEDFHHSAQYDVVYFDAFAPSVQPELWIIDVFRTLFAHMNPGGILVTYSAKGQVRRNLKEAGFITERLPGAPGKREMLRAVKPAKTL